MEQKGQELENISINYQYMYKNDAQLYQKDFKISNNVCPGGDNCL